MVCFLIDAFGKLKSHGNENIPRQGGVLLLSNHVSYLDPFIIAAIGIRDIHFMTRHNVFQIPVLSRLLTALNAYPVRRGSADRAALKHTFSLLKAGNAVLIFPEGTRSVDGDLGEARDGVSFIIHNSNVPAIPLFIKGAERMMPRDSKFIHPAKLSVTVGLPIDFTEVQKIEDKRELYRCMGEQIMQAIADLRDASLKRDT